MTSKSNEHSPAYTVKRAFRHAGKDYRAGDAIRLTERQARPLRISGHLETAAPKRAVKRDQKEAS